jgi:Xaa-Pro aminopeptidase
MMASAPAINIPLTEIDRRHAAIRQLMAQATIDALLIVQRTDLYYFSGTAQNGVLFIPLYGTPLLFVKKYLPRARTETLLENVIGIQSIREVPGLIEDLHGCLPEVIGLELDVMPVKEFNFLQHLFKTPHYVDASPAILKVRMLKSNWEIRQLAHTAKCSQRTFDYIGRTIRPGLSEMEFAGMYETFARLQGHAGQLKVRNYQSLGYPWHVLSGRSGGMVGLLDSPASGQGTSAAFPCGAGPKKLASGEPIMIDLGFVCNGYHMDETRMFAIGSLPPEAARACQAAIEIHNAVIAQCKPGVTADTLFNNAVALATALGYGEQFLGPRGHKVTFIGHGIGLELVEPPFIAKGRQDVLQPGMTLALEPKMVFQDAFAAGIESVVQITPDGARLLSKVPVRTFVC